jgi:hypothetical protein
LAESFEATEEWDQAARNWEQARQDPKLTSAEKARLLYRLGRCYAQDQRAKEAAGAWGQALALGGDEAQAAALRLAELKLDADARADAVEALAAALKPVAGPDDYRNKLVPLQDARQIVEKAAQACRSRGDWETAAQVAELYNRLAPPSGADVMAGLIADEWAKALAEQARQAPPGPEAAALEEKARAQLRAAGLAYEKAAEKVAAGPDQANWLANSAERLIQARDHAHAIEVLTRYTQLDAAVPEERLVRAWYELGQAHHNLQQYAAARAAYQHCLKPGGPYLLRARGQLALIDLVENRFDEAERALQENKKALLEASPPDPALQEHTLFALAEVAFQRQEAAKPELREYGTAEQRLLGALQQYPDGPAALRARMRLAHCYWNAGWLKSEALQRGNRPEEGPKLSDEERQQYTRQRNENLVKAAEQYELVERQLLTRLNAGGRLTAAEAVTLREAAYWGVDCYFYMEKYEETVRRYSALALRYQQQPEGLIAMHRIWYCQHFYLREPEKAAGALSRLREAFKAVPEAAFDGIMLTHRRDYWDKQLAEAERMASGTP